MNKGGLSAVITTVLVIAISVILVALLGALVLNELKKTPDPKATAQSITLRLSVPAESLFVNQSQKQVNFLLQRRAGKGDMVGFIVVLDNEEGNSETYEQFKSVSLAELESRQFSFMHTQQGTIAYFKLIPIIKTLKGEEYLSSSPIEYAIGPDGRPRGINPVSRINIEQNTTQNNNTNNTQNSNYNPQNQTGLISYITFESSTWSNNQIADSIETNNHLNIQGSVQQTQGIAGQGIRFNENPTNVTFSNNELTNRGTTDFSIIVWAKPEKYRATQMILAKGNVRPGNFNPDGNGYGIAATDGVSYGEISDGGSTTSSKIEIGRGGVRVNMWHQFAIVRAGAQLAYYIDGKLMQTKTGNQVLNLDTDQTISIGSRRCLYCTGNEAGDYFIGTIDEIMLFNRSVNAQEITNNYNHFNRGMTTPATCNIESFKTLWSVSGPPQIMNSTWKDTHVQPFSPAIEHKTEMSHYIAAPGNSYGNYLNGGFEPTYPHINSSGAMIAGGVPQRANIEASKRQIQNWLTNSNSWYYIPSGYNGYIYLDYEEWPLAWDQLNYTAPNAGTSPYIIESRNIVRSQHPDWNNAQIETEAERQWNEGARTFTIEMFRETKRLFPDAKVGFYGYPATPFYRGYMSEYGDRLRTENDQLGWLWSEVDYIAPAVYLTGEGLEWTEGYEYYARQYLYSSMLETRRIADQYHKPVIPFISYFAFNMNNFGYADDYLDDKNLKAESEIPFLMGANAAFIWGYEYQMEPVITPTTGRLIGGLTGLENYLQTKMGPQLQTIKANGCSPDQLL